MPASPAHPRASNPPLGGKFRLLLFAGIVSNAGDGVRLAGGPLLVASLTGDALLVGTAIFIQQIPWLIFALPAGAWIDRLDRAKLLSRIAIVRATIAAGLVATLLTGALSLPLLFGFLFVIGVAEVIGDTTFSALLPEIVPGEQLSRANGRFATAFVVCNQLFGPALGAALFAVGSHWPFVFEAVVYSIAATTLVVLHRGHRRAARGPQEPSTIRRDIVEGLKWTWASRPVRLLALLLSVMNITFSGAFAAWVLYAQVQLGVPAVAFGLLVTASAIGGLLGSLAAARLLDRYGPTVLLRIGLIVETGVLAVLGLTDSGFVAGGAMFLFGAHAAIWGVVAATTRQRLVPETMQGRIGSVYFMLAMGGSAIGALLGGFTAQAITLQAPFLIAAGADVILTAVVWRALGGAAFRIEAPVG